MIFKHPLLIKMPYSLSMDGAFLVSSQSLNSISHCLLLTVFLGVPLRVGLSVTIFYP